MCRASAIPRRIRWGARACAIVAMICSLSIASAAKGRTLFLLTGTFLNDAGQTFPVRLYTVSTDHKLKLFREVVPGSEGLYEALDDTAGNIYVAFPYFNGVSRAPTRVSIVHESQPALVDVVGFNPTGMLNWDRATATSVAPDLKSYALFTLFPVSAVHVDDHVAFMRLIRGSATSLVAIGGQRPVKGPRVTRDQWGFYSHLTFYGSPGGPGQYFTPQAVVEGGNLVMHLGGKTILVDQAPPELTASAAAPRTVWILAANSEFLASVPLGNGPENFAAPAPATIYVHNRQSNTWKEIRSAGNMPECRIFGPWLATMVRTGIGPGRGSDTNPGHNDESHQWIKDYRPDVREEFGAIDFLFDIPGIFTLDNLIDGRQVTLKTNQEDSEVLDVRKNGLVLYRVNDEIYSAQIEGDKLSAPTLVAKGDDVPEVHWAFWSNAQVETKPKPEPPSVAEPSSGQ